jgi:KDO2-lipid IV(A) lauroyltransferase
MAIDPRVIINSPVGLNFAYLLGRCFPYWLGHRIAIFIADRISARRDWKLVRAARCNQWMVNGGNVNQAALDKLVANNFRSIACSVFDLYHNLNNRAASLRIFEPHPTAIQLVQRPEFTSRGLVLAGVHLSNFDMAFQMGGLAGIKALVLTLPELNAGYRNQLEMRQKYGMHILQASVGTIKQAVEHLRSGGLVITGIDRPDESYIYKPTFFGRPACIPIHHIFLAVKAHVPVVVAATLRHPDGKYHFLFSDPIEMQPHPDRHTEIIHNAEAVLSVAEDFIRHDPSQWAMTFPVWPDMVDQVPV